MKKRAAAFSMRRLVLLVLFVSCYFDAALPSPSPWETSYELARQSEQAGRWEEAIKHIERALEGAKAASPISTSAHEATHVLHNHAGALHLRNGYFGDAQRNFAVAVALAPRQSLYAFNLGLALSKQRKMELAADAFLNASQSSDFFPEALYQRGICLDSLNRFNEASEAFVAALGPLERTRTRAHTPRPKERERARKKKKANENGGTAKERRKKTKRKVLLHSQAVSTATLEASLGRPLRIIGGVPSIRWDLHNALLSATPRPQHAAALRELEYGLQETLAMKSRASVQLAQASDISKEQLRSREAHLQQMRQLHAKFLFGTTHMSTYIAHWHNFEVLWANTTKQLTHDTKRCKLHSDADALLRYSSQNDELCSTQMTPMRAMSWAPAPLLARTVHAWQITNLIAIPRGRFEIDYSSSTIKESRRTTPSAAEAILGRVVFTKERAMLSRLTIGYVSADWGTHHPMAPIITALLAGQRRYINKLKRSASRLFIVCFNVGTNLAAGDRAEIFYVREGFCDEFVQLLRVTGDGRSSSTEDAVDIIRSKKVDVLFDLGGYTAGGQPEIFACRPAPIQALWLGWPVTGGHPLMYDFAVTDSNVQPPEAPNLRSDIWAEPLALLPKGHIFPPAGAATVGNDRIPLDTLLTDIKDAAVQFMNRHSLHKNKFVETNVNLEGIKNQIWENRRLEARAALGIPSNAFVAAAHNQLFKVGPNLLDVWAGVLRRVQSISLGSEKVRAVLWLLEHPADGLENIRLEIASRGLDSLSVVVASPFEKSRVAHVERLALIADCFLDTMRYSGGATTADAVAAGLKVIILDSKAGLDDSRLFSSPVERLSQSLVHQHSNGKIWTANLKDYEDSVVQVAKAALISSRSILRHRKKGHTSLKQAVTDWASTFTRMVLSMTEIAVAESSGWRNKSVGFQFHAHSFFPVDDS